MSLLGRLGEKSWDTPGAEGFADPADYRPSASTIGLYALLGVASVIFMLLAGAYVMRMGLPGTMDHGGGDWRAMPEPALLWTNTGILAASSLAWELARRSTYYDAGQLVRLAAIAGGVAGLAFLLGQVLLWRQYQAAGYYLAANPANAFFYLLTAVHGLHLAGGLVACARTIGEMGDQNDTRVFRNVRLCANYWHFLLIVWLLLAWLLIST